MLRNGIFNTIKHAGIPSSTISRRDPAISTGHNQVEVVAYIGNASVNKSSIKYFRVCLD